jgi:hypothetical protein
LEELQVLLERGLLQENVVYDDVASLQLSVKVGDDREISGQASCAKNGFRAPVERPDLMSMNP